MILLGYVTISLPPPPPEQKSQRAIDIPQKMIRVDGWLVDGHEDDITIITLPTMLSLCVIDT